MVGYLAVIAVFVAIVFFLKDRHREVVAQNWKCATATIEDVHTRVIQQVNTARGGVSMLYEVSILAKYISNGKEHEQWVVEQPPVSLAESELQTFRWKGQHCVVRWKTSNPEQMIAEVD